MLKIDSVSRTFGATRAVDELSFVVRPGEIFALLGPNGAGKTTTIKMILGLLKPDSGAIYFQGGRVCVDDNRYKAKIGYVPENGALYENLTGREFLRFIGHLHHLDQDRLDKKIEPLMELLELSEKSDGMIREYSKGMKQKLLILSALLHDPDLIILDEPFAGLDANAVSVFKEIMRAAAREGKAVVFCSHILEVVERLVDRILIIDNGRELASGTPEEIIARTGAASLDRAFNQLTGAEDATSQARRVVDLIREGGAGSESDIDPPGPA